jgi:hypothetical protein
MGKSLARSSFNLSANEEARVSVLKRLKEARTDGQLAPNGSHQRSWGLLSCCASNHVRR